MVAELTAVRFEREKDSLKKTTRDAGDTDRSSSILRLEGEAETYFSHATRAWQHVKGTKTQERHLCGPRLEAQLTGRAESAIEGVQVRMAVPGA